jgi:hypothetical protein
MMCTACVEAGDMVPFLRQMRALDADRWARLTATVIRLKHQECDDYAKCVCLHRLPQQ